MMVLGKRHRQPESFRSISESFFPPEDNYATCMARLCILREDLWVDIKGILAGPYEQLDANGSEWRRNYFFRNYLKTIHEIASALHALNEVRELSGHLENGTRPHSRGRSRPFAERSRRLTNSERKYETVSADISNTRSSPARSKPLATTGLGFGTARLIQKKDGSICTIHMLPTLFTPCFS